MVNSSSMCANNKKKYQVLRYNIHTAPSLYSQLLFGVLGTRHLINNLYPTDHTKGSRPTTRQNAIIKGHSPFINNL